MVKWQLLRLTAALEEKLLKLTTRNLALRAEKAKLERQVAALESGEKGSTADTPKKDDKDGSGNAALG